MKQLCSLLLFSLCLTFLPQQQALAQAPKGSPAKPSPATTSAPDASSAQAATTPTTQTTQYTLPPDKLAKSRALYDLRGKLLIVDTLYGLLVLLGVLYFGVAAKYRDLGGARHQNTRFPFKPNLSFPFSLFTIDRPSDSRWTPTSKASAVNMACLSRAGAHGSATC